MLPFLSGRPIRVELRDTLGPHLAATSIPSRLILLDRAVLQKTGDFERILIHEIFHFVWVRLSNAIRLDWEKLLASETEPGELGWSAEWRKLKLQPSDPRERSPRWKRYARESFCDSAAWLFADLKHHDEFTLPAPSRRARKKWLERNFASHDIAI
ncbi:MAG: hypothetical protein ABSF22_08875 [Bryobacteraceae bacterium]